MTYVTLLRETETGDEIEIRVEYDYHRAERAVLWGDYPEPGCPESATLYPPKGVVLTDEEEEYLAEQAIEAEADDRAAAEEAYWEDRDDD